MAAVFISHRNADSEKAELLAEEIRSKGHDVWLDIWEVEIGDSIIEKMNQGLSDSGYVIVCYSSSGVLAPWMGREWMSALARQLRGHHVKVLPVRLTGKESPAILADIAKAQ